MRTFREYFRPGSPEEAVDLKQRYGEQARYLAGGSDLLVDPHYRAEVAIDIRFAGLGYVREEADAYVIGGSALLRDAERGVGHVAGGMLGRAFFETAPWLIRNAATVAGNLANASPSADSVPALLVLDAEVVLVGSGEERVPVMQVMSGPHQTSLGDRLIREIRIPKSAGPLNGVFVKVARSESDVAQVNLAVALRQDGDVVRDVRIALGSVAPVIVRASKTENLLEGKELTDELLRSAEESVREEIRPISDWRATAGYRRRVAGVVLRRALLEATGRSWKESSS